MYIKLLRFLNNFLSILAFITLIIIVLEIDTLYKKGLFKTIINFICKI